MKSDFNQDLLSPSDVYSYGVFNSGKYDFVADMGIRSDYINKYDVQSRIYGSAGSGFGIMVPGTPFMSSTSAFIGMASGSMIPDGVFMSTTGSNFFPGSVSSLINMYTGARSPSGLGFDRYGKYGNLDIDSAGALISNMTTSTASITAPGPMMGMPGPMMSMPVPMLEMPNLTGIDPRDYPF